MKYRPWIASAALLAIAGCSSTNSARALEKDDNAFPVKVAPVSRVSIEDTVPILGTLVAEHRASIGAESEARVVEVVVREGQRVVAGQTLVHLASDDAKVRLDAASGAMEQAQIEAGAEEQIARSRMVQAQNEVGLEKDRLASAVTVAEARRDESQARLKQLIKGPRPQEIERARADVEGQRLVVEAAKQTAALAGRTLKRKKDLFEKGYVAEQDFDQAQNDFDQASKSILFAEEEQRAKELYLTLLKEGTPKEELDQARAQVRAAEEGLRAAKTALGNLERTRQSEIAAIANYRASIAKARAIRAGGPVSDPGAKLRLAQQAMARTQVRAPMSGTVTSIKVVPGQVLRPGQQVAEIIEAGGLRLEATVMEQDIAKVRDGLQVRITSKAVPGRTWDGFVREVLPPGSAEGMSPRIIVSLRNANGLRAGSVASGDILLSASKSEIAIPVAALQGPAASSSASVYVVRGSVARLVQVVLGEQKGDLVYVKSGLAEGDVVVIEGADALSDGSLVRIRTN